MDTCEREESLYHIFSRNQVKYLASLKVPIAPAEQLLGSIPQSA